MSLEFSKPVKSSSPAWYEVEEYRNNKEDDDAQPGEEGNGEVERVIDALRHAGDLSECVLDHGGDVLHRLQPLLQRHLLLLDLRLLVLLLLLLQGGAQLPGWLLDVGGDNVLLQEDQQQPDWHHVRFEVPGYGHEDHEGDDRPDNSKSQK